MSQVSKKATEGGVIPVAGARRTRVRVRNVLGIVSSILFVALLLRSVRWAEIGASFRNADLGLLAFAAVILTGVYVLLAVRWRLLLWPRSVRLGIAFTALSIGACCNVVLPVRGGDAVRAVLMSQQARLPLSYVFASVMLEKLLDVAVLVLLATAAVMVIPLPPWFETMLILGSVGVAVVTVACVIVQRRGVAAVSATLGYFLPVRAAQWLDGLLRSFHEGLYALGSARRMAQAVALSLAVWIGISVASLVTALALHLAPVTFAEIVIVAAVISLGQVIPSSPGAIGTYEFLGVAALALFGVGREPALEFAIALHLLSIAVQMALGMASMARAGLSFARVARIPDVPDPV